MSKFDLICILGPTASGKTSLGVKLASLLNGEIISADSRQVYKGLDIGSGKDLSEYLMNGVEVPYHLIDIVDPKDEYNLFQFQQDFIESYKKIIQKNKHPILVGGTGLYIDAVLNGYRLFDVPENSQLRKRLSRLCMNSLINELKTYKTLHNQTDITDKERLIRAIEIAKFEESNSNLIHDFPKIKSCVFGIQWEPELLRKRIKKRLIDRLNQGMIDEVATLIRDGVTHERMLKFGLEYKWVTQYLLNQITYQELIDGLSQAIGKFAKRQRTWFRRMERNGSKINWLDGSLSITKQCNIIISHLHS